MNAGTDSNRKREYHIQPDERLKKNNFFIKQLFQM